MIRKIQKLATLSEGRPETGAMSFGDDWPGVFIRGDNAIHFGMTLKRVLNGEVKEKELDPITVAVLRGLVELLESCQVK